MPSIEIVDKTSSILEWDPETRIVIVEPKAKINFRIKQDENFLGKASWDVFDFSECTSWNWKSKDKPSDSYPNTVYQNGITFEVDKEDLGEEMVFWVEAIFKPENTKKEKQKNTKKVRPDQSKFLFNSQKITSLPSKMPKTVIVVKIQKPKPKIVEARWYNPNFKGFNMSEDGWHKEGSLLSPDSEKKIRSNSLEIKKYGEWVLLAIKTRGLIGENLKISLWDDDKPFIEAYDKTSEYNTKDDVDNKNNEDGYYKERKKGEAYEDDKLINFNYQLSKRVNKYGFVKALIQIPESWKQIIQDEFADDTFNYSGKVAVKIDHSLFPITQDKSKNGKYPNLYRIGDPRAPIYYGKYLLIKDEVNNEPEPIPNIPPQIAVIRDSTPMEAKKNRPL